MKQCQCGQCQLLTGPDAERYKKDWLEYITDEHGWRQLWRCHECASYWEMTWQGGGGFDDGVMTLSRLSANALKERWPKLER